MFIHYFLNKRMTSGEYLHLAKENRWWKRKCGTSSRFVMFWEKELLALLVGLPLEGVDWHREEFISCPAARSWCWQSCFQHYLPPGEKTTWEFCWIWSSFVKTLYDASQIFFLSFFLFVTLLTCCFGLSYMQESYQHGNYCN